MTGSARRLARDWLPPAVARRLSGESAATTVFDDGCASWREAVEAAQGYDAPSILAQVAASTDRVRSGQAVFERDGLTFDSPESRWPLVAAMLLAADARGHLRVLDFGGSLGSAYWQHRRLLTRLDLSWGVVEQAEFVREGARFSDGTLRFYSTIDECRQDGEPDLILLSSVLQYLEDPYEILHALSATGAGTLLIDRTPVSELPHDVATVQRVPEHIYRASYPAWILSKQRLVSALDGWSLVEEFPGIEPAMRTSGGIDFDWRGFLFTRHTA